MIYPIHGRCLMAETSPQIAPPINARKIMKAKDAIVIVDQ